MSRTATTLLLLTRDTLIRADLSRPPKATLVGVWTQARPEGVDVPSLVEMALTTGNRPGRQVWVLCSDLWTQTLALPAIKTMGMTGQDLAAALNFEAEALSGMSAFEATVGQRPLPSQHGENAYWIVQGRVGDRNEVDAVAHKTGARLLGLLHPGGLPRPLDSEARSAKSWQRVELWPDAVVFLHGEGGRAPRVQVLNTDPQMGRWQADWARWQDEQGLAAHTEILVGPGLQIPTELGAAKLFALDKETALSAWLIAWAEQAAMDDFFAPVLRPVPRPLTSGQRGLIAAALGAFVAAACVGHYLWLTHELRASHTQLQQLQEPGKRLVVVQKQLKEQETKRDTLKTDRERLEQLAHRLHLQRLRLAHLLRVLAETKHEDLLLQKLDTDPQGEPRIHGICLRPELADQFARTLAQKLRGHGWEVQSPKKQAQYMISSGGPWSFEIHCKSTWTDPNAKKPVGQPVLE